MSEDRSTLYARQLAALIREETVSQNGPFPAFHALLRQEFPRLFDPEESVRKRDVTGATGFEQVAKQIDFWKKELEK